MALFAVVAILGFGSLGTWQIKRLHWKLDLIARVEARVHADPVAAPGPAEWAGMNVAADEYRRVTVTGTLLNDREVQVYAATSLGAGYWVLTPLKTTEGWTVLVNRGFVPTDKRDPKSRPQGEISGPVTVTGLLRPTEPGGGFLRSNDPAAERWYSRDVAAIAATRQLTDVAPYFIDADATANPGGLPVGGLTQLVFPNNHLVYAITWYVLALMGFGMLVYLVRTEMSGRHRSGPRGK
ncbi:SURF1 family protein [Rhizobium sp. BK251]|uniref:SURF1 family protein n=1 Tax=Rhizobium sp. BK251 TaxID=2512125 RepID=UPI001FE00382|nr:SURF1 family protein [Rhizobium sp. BK251]